MTEPDLRPLVGVGNPVPRAKWVWLAPTLVVVVVVAAGAALFAASRMEESVASPERVTELFLEAVAEDDLAMSYGLLCQKRRRGENAIEFRETVLDGRDTARAALDRGRRRVSGEGDERRVTYTVPRRGDDARLEVRLEREPERWAVCSFDPGAG